MKLRLRRPLAMLLTVVMLLGLIPTAAFAVEEDGLCPHHLQHDNTCGYVAAVDGQSCQHQHDETCGYTEGTPEVPCDKGCTDTDDDGVIDHVEDCSYRPAVPESPCTHSHDADCGYVEASAESPCRYECGVCPVEALIQALPDPIQAGDAVAVEEAQTAYTALTEEECAQIDPVLTEKLFQAVDTLLLLAEEDPDAAQPSLQPTQQIQLQEDETVLTAEGGELKSGTYVLTGDLTLTNNITISAEKDTKVTINLNGYTLTGNGNGSVITYLPNPKSDAELIINGAGEGGTSGTITGGTGTKITSYGRDSYYGGGIYVDTDEYVPVLGEGDNSLTINDVVISKNEATNGGGAFIGVIASAKLNGVTFSKNKADWGGGLFGSIGHHGTGYDLSLRECTFTENTAHRGGGLYANGAFQCVNTSFRGNTAKINEDEAGSGNGGAIYHYGSTLNVAGCTIEANHAERNGGGVYASVSGGQSSFGFSYVSGSSRPTVVRDNTAVEYGGGLYLEQRVSFGGEISGNSAKAGGGIYLAGGHVKLSGTVTENKATDTSEGALGGGGIAMLFTAAPHVFDDISTIKSVISGNTSAAGGGGISILIGGTDAQRGVSFDGATISGNTAAGDGGGVLLRVEESAPACEKNTTSYSDSGFSLSDTVVESNESTGGIGGGIAIDRQGDAAWGTEIDLSGVTIRENKAEKEGGGAAIRGVQISFDGESPVFGNLSDTAGDDVFFTTPGTLTLPTPKAQNIQNLGRWYKDEANARYREGNITGTLESIENGSGTYALTAGEIVVLTFDPAGGRLAAGTETPLYAAKDSEISAPKDPTKGNRNRFLGWFTGSKTDSGEITYGELVDFTQPVEVSMDLFARWQAFYLVEFELGYGASFPEGVETSVQVDVGQPITKPADPTRQGYQFNGWVDEDGNSWQFETVVTGDMTLYASWERIAGEELPSVILHAETYGGSPAPEDQVLPKVELMDRTAVPQPLGVPTLEGFAFEYWYVDYFQLLRDSGAGREADAFEQQYTNAIEYIEGLLNNPELTEEEKAEYQEAIDSYQKILYGYRHAVLYGEGMGISEDDLEADGISVAFSYPEDFLELLTYACYYVPNEDTTVTLHAQWSKDGELVETMATLTYVSNGGTTYAKEQYPSGAVVPLNKIPTRHGYDFTGWYADRSLREKVAFLTMDSDKTVYAGWVPRATGTITVTPAAIIIYMGGKDGYEGTVNDEGEIEASKSLPEPGFVFDLPDDLKSALAAAGEDITAVTFQSVDNESKTWKVELYQGLDESAANKLYTIVPTYDDPDPIRVVFTDGDKHIVSDNFEVGLEINKEFGMSLYTGPAGTIKAVYGGKEYPVELGEGNLTVLGTTEKVSITTVTDTAPTNGQPGAIADADTTYTINDSEVAVTGGDVSLLFDNIINNIGNDRTSKLEERASEWLADEGITPSEQHQFAYELKYLDLVDANNGNVWVTASQNLTIYWPLPTGADADSLKVLHFKDLHRDMTTGEIESEIANCAVESLAFQVDGNYITFEVGQGGFSPFALVWEEKIPTYTITATSNGNGSITPAGVTTVQEGGSQSYTIKADSGYHISDVKVNGASVGAVESYTFTNVQSNQTIAVTFSRNSSGGGGGGGGHTKPSDPDEDIPDEPGPADPFDTGVGNWLNTKDHNAYLGGYGGGLFGPDDNMTRGQAAQMFYNLLLDKDVPITVSFTDVTPDAWYATAVNTLASLGIVTGYGNGQFGPDDSITRAQFTTIAMRFANLDTSGENIFTDVSEDDWFYEFVVGAIKYGWIGGYPDGRFGPNDTITRAQVTTIVNRMLGRSADEDYVERNIEELTRFTDVPDTHWAYYNIMEATNAHDYDRVSGGEDWTRLHK